MSGQIQIILQKRNIISAHYENIYIYIRVRKPDIRFRILKKVRKDNTWCSTWFRNEKLNLTI